MSEWGPFGLGMWKGHEGVYCRVCGWPVWHVWLDDKPPPGSCVEGKSSARGCTTVMDKLKLNAWVRAATKTPEPHASMEMLRGVTGYSWAEIEAMSDKDGKGSVSIADLKSGDTK